MSLDHPVLSAMLPVVLLIAVGFVAGRRRLIRAEAVGDLSNLVFLVLVQALLFRTMATAHLERLDLRSVALYYVVVGALFFFWRRDVLVTVVAGMAVYLPLHLGLGW